ncbi:hypothetical protein ACMYSQ_004025 [Aspergillus niger]
MHRLNSGQGKRLFSICPVGASEQNEAIRISHAVLVRFGFLPSNFVPVVLTCSSALEAKTTLALSEKKRGKSRMEGESEFTYLSELPCRLSTRIDNFSLPVVVAQQCLNSPHYGDFEKSDV